MPLVFLGSVAAASDATMTTVTNNVSSQFRGALTALVEAVLANNATVVAAAEQAANDAVANNPNIVLHSEPGAPNVVSGWAGVAQVWRDRGFRSPTRHLSDGSHVVGGLRVRPASYDGLALVVRDRAFRSPMRVTNAGEVLGVTAGVSQQALGVTVCGDSLASALGPYIDAETDAPVTTEAIGGQTTAQIAARQGGKPALVTLTDGVIPAGTTAAAVSSVTPQPYSSPAVTTPYSRTGTLAGVHGTLRNDGTGVYTFTRTDAGAEVWGWAGMPWIPDVAVARRGDAFIYWAWRNNYTDAPEDLFDLTDAMIAYQEDPNRFLLLEILPWDTEPIGSANRTILDARNQAFADRYPGHWVPAAQFLRGPALSMAGITPTAQDNTDIANGVTPSSLRSDAGHLNATGNAVLAAWINDTFLGGLLA